MHNPYREATPFATPNGPLTEADTHERIALVEHYSWAIPTDAAIRTLVAHDPLLEVGAGRGYWAWCVEQMGGDIVATDLKPPRDTWTTVKAMDARDAVEDHPDRTLVLCSPETDRRWPTDAIHASDARYVVTIGNEPHPTTRLAHELGQHWFEVDTRPLPTFFGLPSRLAVHRRHE